MMRANMADFVRFLLRCAGCFAIGAAFALAFTMTSPTWAIVFLIAGVYLGVLS